MLMIARWVPRGVADTVVAEQAVIRCIADITHHDVEVTGEAGELENREDQVKGKEL